MLAKCFTILANRFYKWYKCLRMLANTFANLTNVLRVKREHDACVTNLHNTYCGCFSLSYICQPLSSQLYSLSTFVLHSTKMSIRMLANLYKRLTTYKCLTNNKNACDWLQICCECLQIRCEYAFLANFRSMCLIFVSPQNRARVLTKAHDCLAIML